MENIKSLYQKLWKSLIRPRRIPYSSQDLGETFMAFSSTCALRMDFKLENSIDESFHLSIYLPCNDREEIPKDLSYVVYCHTHNGNRVEGLYLVEKVLNAGYGFVVFDFRANGYSTGEYVTLGWLEVLDINQVILFLKTEVKAKHICLWGRSMGGSSSLFYLSGNFRNRIDAVMHRLKKEPITWASRAWIDCVVIDSCFPRLVDSIQLLVKNKTAGKVPEWLVGVALSVVAREVKLKAGISIDDINPENYVSDIRSPVYMAVGNQDELVSTEKFVEMFRKLDSKIKKIKIFQGEHADERSDVMLDHILDFVKEMFRLKNTYLETRGPNTTYLNDVTMNVPLSNLAKLNINNLKQDTKGVVQQKQRPDVSPTRRHADPDKSRLKIYDDEGRDTGRQGLHNEHALKTNTPSFLGQNKAKFIKPTATNDLASNKQGKFAPIKANKNSFFDNLPIANEDYFADFEDEAGIRQLPIDNNNQMINKEGFNLRLSHKPIQFNAHQFLDHSNKGNSKKEADDPSFMINAEKISQVMKDNNIPEQKLKEVPLGTMLNDLSIRVKNSMNFSKFKSTVGLSQRPHVQPAKPVPINLPLSQPLYPPQNANSLQKVPPLPPNIIAITHQSRSPPPNRQFYTEVKYPPLINQASPQIPLPQGFISQNSTNSPRIVPNFQNPMVYQVQEGPMGYQINTKNTQIEPTVNSRENHNQAVIRQPASRSKSPFVPPMSQIDRDAKRKDYFGNDKGNNSFREVDSDQKEIFDSNDFPDFDDKHGHSPAPPIPQLRPINTQYQSPGLNPLTPPSRTKMVESIQIGDFDISEGKSVYLNMSPSPDIKRRAYE
jgi:alpha/beta superfamily hydrolase